MKRIHVPHFTLGGILTMCSNVTPDNGTYETIMSLPGYPNNSAQYEVSLAVFLTKHRLPFGIGTAKTKTYDLYRINYYVLDGGTYMFISDLNNAIVRIYSCGEKINELGLNVCGDPEDKLPKFRTIVANCLIHTLNTGIYLHYIQEHDITFKFALSDNMDVGFAVQLLWKASGEDIFTFETMIENISSWENDVYTFKDDLLKK